MAGGCGSHPLLQLLCGTRHSSGRHSGLVVSPVPPSHSPLIVRIHQPHIQRKKEISPKTRTFSDFFLVESKPYLTFSICS